MPLTLSEFKLHLLLVAREAACSTIALAFFDEFSAATISKGFANDRAIAQVVTKLNAFFGAFFIIFPPTFYIKVNYCRKSNIFAISAIYLIVPYIKCRKSMI